MCLSLKYLFIVYSFFNILYISLFLPYTGCPFPKYIVLFILQGFNISAFVYIQQIGFLQ